MSDEVDAADIDWQATAQALQRELSRVTADRDRLLEALRISGFVAEQFARRLLSFHHKGRKYFINELTVSSADRCLAAAEVALAAIQQTIPSNQEQQHAL